MQWVLSHQKLLQRLLLLLICKPQEISEQVWKHRLEIVNTEEVLKFGQRSHHDLDVLIFYLLSLLINSLLVTHTNLLWESKPWVFTSPTITFVWTHWPMYCTTLRSLWSPHVPWSTSDSENYLLVSTCRTWWKTWKTSKSCYQSFTKSSYDSSSKYLLNSLVWDNLSVRRAKQKGACNLMYKCSNNLAPAYLCNLFAPRTLNYDFRKEKKKLVLPKPRTDYLKHSFSYSGPILWNNLPEEIRTSNSLCFFKRSFHRWFSD